MVETTDMHWVASRENRSVETMAAMRVTQKAGLSAGYWESHWADHWVVYSVEYLGLLMAVPRVHYWVVRSESLSVVPKVIHSAELWARHWGLRSAEH